VEEPSVIRVSEGSVCPEQLCRGVIHGSERDEGPSYDPVVLTMGILNP